MGNDQLLNSSESVDIGKPISRPQAQQIFVPVCANCMDIRLPNNEWIRMDQHQCGISNITYSHTICPECAKELYPEFFGEAESQ